MSSAGRSFTGVGTAERVSERGAARVSSSSWPGSAYSMRNELRCDGLNQEGGNADCPVFISGSILEIKPLFAGGGSEALGLLGGAKQRLRLVDALLLFELRIGIGDDAGSGLNVHDAVLDQRGA